MRAVVLNKPNDFISTEIEKPKIGDNDILLKMQRAAICGTDMRILNGTKTKGVRYPSVIGHEFSGIIEEVGRNVEGYKVGDRVAVANVAPCHTCDSCITGHENACMNRKAIGYEFNGGFEEYVLIPEIFIKNGNIIKLPKNISFEEGALIEPLSCCIRGIKNAKTKFNDVVLIIGAGPIGLMHLQLAKIVGAKKVIVSEPIEYRREKALKLGADIIIDPTSEDLEKIIKDETKGLGVDVIIMAIGVPGIIDSTLDLCKKNGTLNLFAGFANGEAKIDVNKIHYNEITVNGSTAYKHEDYLEAADLVISGKINLKEIVTHQFTIEEFDKAYQICKNGEGLKVIIKP